MALYEGQNRLSIRDLSKPFCSLRGVSDMYRANWLLLGLAPSLFDRDDGLGEFAVGRFSRGLGRILSGDRRVDDREIFAGQLPSPRRKVVRYRILKSKRFPRPGRKA